MFHVYEHRLANILQTAIDEFCYKSLPQNYDLEIDGLVYIGEIGSEKQAVFKLKRNLRPCNKYEINDESVDSKYGENCETNQCLTTVVDGLTEESHSSLEFHVTDHSSNINCHGTSLELSRKTEKYETNNFIYNQRSEADSTNLDDSTLPYLPEVKFVPLTVNIDGQESCENSKGDVNKIYKCCSTTWHGFHSYENHYVSKHLRYPCPLCSQSFTSKNNMRRHVNCNHGERKRFQCSICEKLFTRPDIVKEHKLTHTKSYKENRCSQCQFVSNKKTILLMHLKKCLRYENIDQDISDDPQLPLDFSSKFKT